MMHSAAMLRESLAGYGVDTSGVAVHPAWLRAWRSSPWTTRPRTDHRGAGGERRCGPRGSGPAPAALDGTRVLLLQLEVPLDAVVAAAELGRRHGVTVILDPAPAQPLPETLYATVDILTPNESEAAALVGFPWMIPTRSHGRAKRCSPAARAA